MNKRIYAAYGSNMNLEQMGYRCPQARVIGTGTLKGYRLTFRGATRGVANIEPCIEGEVPIVLWEITEECEEALDRYEGYPHLYIKENVQIGKHQAMAYVMNEQYWHMPALPSGTYLNTIVQGYTDNGIDLEPLKQAHLECMKELK
nr:gamma-glutamylcyclotransferase family protein [uncultured Niameybacter sp.]